MDIGYSNKAVNFIILKEGYHIMKSVVKRPSFWIMCGSFLLALAIAVFSSLFHPRVPVLNKLEKGINKGNVTTIASCFPPEVQDEISAYGINQFDFLTGSQKANIVYGEISEEGEDNGKVKAFIILNQGDICIDVFDTDIPLVKDGGKWYLSY